MIVEHGASPDGDHIARIGELVLIVERTPVSNFQPGDKIGWSGEDRDLWHGTIVISEPDFTPNGSRDLMPGWHLAWKIGYDTLETHHWRGRSSVRDTRWYPSPIFVMAEMP